MPLNEEQLAFDFFKDMQRLVRRYYPILLGRAFGDAEGVLGVTIAFDLENEFVQDILDELLNADSLKNIGESTLDVYRTLVGRQAQEGWSIDELKRQIINADKTQGDARAEKIARTETASAYSRGSLLAWEESGVVKEVEWLIGADSCPECAALDGMRVPLGDEFADGILHPPAHPLCRCVLSPIVE
jgi:SPP1 gp7 family putative phage head morphogenesis protein